jgi:glutaredoxin 3
MDIARAGHQSLAVVPEIVIYTLPTCIYCHLALRLLRKKGVLFRQQNVAGDRAMRTWLEEATGSGTLPQVFAGERALGGYTDLAALDERGELDAILGVARASS